MAKSKETTKYDPCKGRPYNRYNIYYILERELFLQSHSEYKAGASASSAVSSECNIITGYEHLDLPGLPPRYSNLAMAHDWYMPGKRKLKKREHKKSHGVASFQQIARVVADGWRSIDGITLEYCTKVAKILKDRHTEIKEMGELAGGSFDVGRANTNVERPISINRDGTIIGDIAGASAGATIISNKKSDDNRSIISLSPEASCNQKANLLRPKPTQQQRRFSTGILPTMSDCEMSSRPSGKAPITATVATAAANTGYIPHGCVSNTSHDNVPDNANNIVALRRASYQSFFFVDGVQEEEATNIPSVATVSSFGYKTEVDIPDQDIMAMWYGKVKVL